MDKTYSKIRLNVWLTIETLFDEEKFIEMWWDKFPEDLGNDDDKNISNEYSDIIISDNVTIHTWRNLTNI